MSRNIPLLAPVIYRIHRIEEFGIRKISLIIYILIGVLSVDTVINQISNLPGVRLSSSLGITVFLMMSITAIICQLFVVRFVGKKSISIRNRVTSIRRMHKAVSIAQYSIIIIFIFVILQILLTEPYSPILALLVTSTSYGLSISLMGFFAILWYRHNRSSVLVLLYGVSFATVVIASVSLLSIWIFLFSGKVTTNVFPDS
jgi:hypothetical protein